MLTKPLINGSDWLFIIKHTRLTEQRGPGIEFEPETKQKDEIIVSKSMIS